MLLYLPGKYKGCLYQPGNCKGYLYLSGKYKGCLYSPGNYKGWLYLPGKYKGLPDKLYKDIG